MKSSVPVRAAVVPASKLPHHPGLSAGHRLGQDSIHSRRGQNYTNLSTGVRNKPVFRGGPRSVLHSPDSGEFYVLHKNSTEPVTAGAACSNQEPAPDHLPTCAIWSLHHAVSCVDCCRECSRNIRSLEYIYKSQNQSTRTKTSRLFISHFYPA
eukprot:COSAG02_NODE_2101_length_9808_cov_3.575658_9_plen_153_part_00